MSTIARAVLTAGSAHEDVHALGRLLANAGHESSVSEGRNPFGIVDESVLTAVANYRQQAGVDVEDTIPGVPAHEAGRWIGPNLWDSLLGPLDDDQADEPEPEPAPAASSTPARKPAARKRSTRAKAKS